MPDFWPSTSSIVIRHEVAPERLGFALAEISAVQPLVVVPAVQ